MNAAGEYIGNAIQEMLVVKKTAEVPRILPSINHMKVVSAPKIKLNFSEYSFYLAVANLR